MGHIFRFGGKLVRYSVCTVFRRVDKRRVDKRACDVSSLLASLLPHNPAERDPSGCSVLPACNVFPPPVFGPMRFLAPAAWKADKLPRTVRVSYCLNGLPADHPYSLYESNWSSSSGGRRCGCRELCVRCPSTTGNKHGTWHMYGTIVSYTAVVAYHGWQLATRHRHQRSAASKNPLLDLGTCMRRP